MFDFENTPITHYTRLKAQYNCGPTPVLPYEGNWAKITLRNGTALEVTSSSELDSLLTSTSTATVASTSVNVSDITKIEFGKSVTALPNRSCMLDSWSSLKTVSGFHEGLKTIGDYCFTMGNGGGWGNLSGNTIVLPSTLTSVGQLFLTACGDGNLKVVVNCPVSVFSATNPNYLLSTYDANNPQYVNGVKIGGRYAAEFIAKYPNRVNVPYRNLYNVNSLDDFKNAFDNGNLGTQYPVGSEVADESSPDNPWLVAHYGYATLSSGEVYTGVYLFKKYATSTLAAGSINYDTSTVKTYLNGEYYDSLPQSLKSMISEIALPYYNGSAYTTVDSKVWLMSATEVMGAGGNTEGTPFTLWKQRTGFSSVSNNANNNRRMATASSPSSYIQWGLRSWCNSTSNWSVYNTGALGSVGPSNATWLVPACFIAISTPTVPKPTFASVRQAITDGVAEAFYPVGTEIPDTRNYNGTWLSNPWIIVSYEQVTPDGQTTARLGAKLMRKYAGAYASGFGWNSSYYYGSSTVDTALSKGGAYYNSCSQECLDNITSVKWYIQTNSGINYSARPMIIPTLTELGENIGESANIRILDYFHGLSSAQLLKRRAAMLENAPKESGATYWTRSIAALHVQMYRILMDGSYAAASINNIEFYRPLTCIVGYD